MSHYEDGKMERSWEKYKMDKVSEGEHREGEKKNHRNVKMDINPSSIGAVSVRGPHS